MTSVYTKEKNLRMIMEFKVPKRNILRLTLSINMVQWVLCWERQKRFSNKKRQRLMIEKYCYDKILLDLLGGCRYNGGLFL